MKLEELLNKLIALGWKPRGLELYHYSGEIKESYKGEMLETGDGIEYDFERYSFNDLCSIDSGLWQFVCEYNLYKEAMPNEIGDQPFEIGLGNIIIYGDGNYKYRLMLSSIQPDKERFLLENIKIND